ncbi:MAG: DUF447 family protein [Methanopyri archaeon]|nr:DUF447 family protein [Methanopyri archaeon]
MNPYLARVLSLPELFDVSNVEEAKEMAERVRKDPLSVPLRFYGIEPKSVNEVVAVTDGPEGPNAAPVGLRTFEETPEVHLYPGSKTYANVLDSKMLTVCVVDPITLARTLLEDVELEEVEEDVKVVEDTRAFVVFEVFDVEEGEPAVFKLTPVHAGLLHPRPRAVVRAEGALVDALVELTRVHLDPGHAERCEERLRVVERTTRDPRYLGIVEAVREVLSGGQTGEDTGSRVR